MKCSVPATSQRAGRCQASGKVLGGSWSHGPGFPRQPPLSNARDFLSFSFLICEMKPVKLAGMMVGRSWRLGRPGCQPSAGGWGTCDHDTATLQGDSLGQAKHHGQNRAHILSGRPMSRHTSSPKPS